MNNTGIAAGVVANIQATLSANAPTTSIAVTNPVAVDSSGSNIPSVGATGAVIAIPVISSLTCGPSSISGGGTSTCTVTISNAAPAGGSTVALRSNNPLLTVPASVTVNAGVTTTTFAASAGGTIPSNQSALITATLGSSSQTATVNLLAPALVSGVACNPASLGQSASSTCTVTLTQAAPAGGSTVTLGSNNALLTVPASVAVSAGATTATFTASAGATIPSNQSALITATLGSSSQTATINLLAPVLVSGVVCNPTSLGQSASSTCTVTLTQAAPVGGSTVTLGSNNSLLAVPASVTVSAGVTTANFNASAGATIASNQSALITATLGSSSQTATINLLAPVLVSGVVCNPASLGQSASSTCTVTLTQAAPAGGSTLTLGSNNPLLTVPASVTVSAGATTANFNANAAGTIPSNQSALITATLGTSSKTATISLLAPVLVSGVVCNPTSLGQSASSTCTVTLSQAVPAGGSTLTLGSNNAWLTVPGSVTVSAGATTANFNASAAGTIPSNQSALITATLGSSSQTATINLLAPVLVSGVACNPASLGQSASSTCTVTLTQAAPAGGSTLTLGSNNALLTVPGSVTVSAGATTANFNASAGATIASNQSATITATLGTSSKTATISLLAPVLVSGVVCNPASLGQSASSTCTVTLTQAAPAGGSTLTLGSNNPLLIVPASVTVNAGVTTANFSVSAGGTIPNNQGVTVTATLGSSSQTATINLLAPVLVSGVACNPASLGQSASSTCTVTLTQAAPAGGSTLTLGSNNALLTVPASVTVNAGATTANFSVSAGGTIPSNQSALITATLGTSSQTATINLQAPVLVSGVVCNPTSLGQSASSTCTLTLTQAAPAGGSTVTLGSNNALLTVPASVTVNAGATTTNFNASAGATIPSNQNALITATLASSSQTATINLLAPVMVSGVVCNPASLSQSASSTCTVTLTQTAPAGGSTVTLGSNNALLTVPASVTVSSGATTANFTANASGTIASNQSATITATLGNSSQTAVISLQAPTLLTSLSCSPGSLTAGSSANCLLGLSQPFPAMSIASVTSCGPQNYPGSTCTVPSVGAGHLIVVGWQAGGGGDTTVSIASISDNAGNTYSEAGAARSIDTIAGSVVDIWYAANSVPGATTLSITPTASVANAGVVIWEVSGADIYSPLDQSATLNSQAATVTPSGAQVSTANAADFVVSLAAVSANVTGIESGNSFVTDSSLKGNGWAHLITAAPGTYGAAWNQSPAGTYAASTVAFRAAGTVLLSSNNPVLTVPSSVVIAPGATSANFNAVASATFTSNQSANVTATLGSSSQTAAIALVAPVLVSGISCSPTSLNPNASTSCTVTLSQTAPAGGASVTLASNNPLLTLPASVLASSGSVTATFNATAAATITTSQNAVITATLGTSSRNVTIGLVAPILVSAVSCSPASLTQSGTSTCTVALTQTAPAGGANITLGSNNALLTVPPSVIVNSGATTANFTATAGATIPSNQTATITATLGTSLQTATIALVSPALLSSISCNPTGLMSGQAATCTISLSQTASTGSTVSLNSNSALLTVPSSVTIPAGNMSASIQAASGTIRGDTQAVLTATLGSSSQQVNVPLWAPPSLSSLTCTPTKLRLGSASTCTVSMTKAAGALSVAISSSNAALSVPASVTVPLGKSSATFSANAVASASGWILLMATYSGKYSTLALTITQTTKQRSISETLPGSSSGTHLVSMSCGGKRLRTGAQEICNVQFANSPESQPVKVDLASSSPAVKMPGSIILQPGQSSASFRLDVASTGGESSARIVARMGEESVEENVALDSASSALNVPAHIFAQAGSPVEFAVSAADRNARLVASTLPAGASFDPVSGKFEWNPDISQQGRHHLLFRSIGLAGELAVAESMIDVESGTPVVTGLANAASRSKKAVCGPEAIGSIEGRWLVQGSPASDPTGNSMQLSGAGVSLNGVSVPVLSVSQSHIEFLCPAVAPGIDLDISLQTSGASIQTGRTVSTQAAPGIFTVDETGRQGAIVHSGTTVMAMVPNYQQPAQLAESGDLLTIYASGIPSGSHVSLDIAGNEVAPQSISVQSAAGIQQINMIMPDVAIGTTEIPVHLVLRMPDGSSISSNEVMVGSVTSK